MIGIMMMCQQLGAQAQTFNEWFRQKATQRKYLMQQIVALEAYKKVLRTGYRVVDGGAKLIGDIKKGELNLHKDYFGARKSVNPKVRRYAQVAGTVQMAADVVTGCRHLGRKVRASGNLSSAEISYLQGVFRKVLEDCTAMLDELILLSGNQQADMTDDQRLKRIDELCAEMEGTHSFLRGFGSQALQLATSRKASLAELERLGNYYGIDKDGK